MSRLNPVLVLCLLSLGAAPPPARAASDAVVSGVVRDFAGAPQIGAVVELLRADTSVAARALTDEHGRYLLAALVPGTYQLRATAAFLLPALRDRLSLQAGAHTVANLTLTAIFSAEFVLPAEKRAKDEPADDWKWTLRSAASRPLLRLADPDGPTADDSSSDDGSSTPGTVASDGPPHSSRSTGTLEALSGRNLFAESGPHETLSLETARANGITTQFGESLGVTAAGDAPSVDAMMAVERAANPGAGGTHLLVGYSARPGIDGASGNGLQIVRLASAEQIALGDAVIIDAGTLLSAERLLESRVFTTPHVRVTVHVSGRSTVEYGISEGQRLGSGDFEALPPAGNALADANGRPVGAKGVYQELAATRSSEDGRDVTRIALAYVTSSVNGVQGIGRLSASERDGLPILADEASGTFRLATQQGAAYGVGVSWTRRLTPAISARLQEAAGTVPVLGSTVALSAVPGAMHTELRAALGASMQARSTRTGTVLDAGYRWQKADTVGQVYALDAEPNDAYLSFCLRQKFGTGRYLHGVGAVVEATNLLAQGYQPVIGPDGETLFLAQVPRTLQAGLSFSF